MKQLYFIPLYFSLFFISCKKDTTPALILSFTFDATLPRLDNTGAPAAIAPDNAAQSPSFKQLGVHYIELTPDKFTPAGKGLVLYKTAEVTTGGDLAIDFDKQTIIDPINNTLAIPQSVLKAGNYQYIRISLGYQRYDIIGLADVSTPGLSGKFELPLNVASFVGFNTYINKHTIKDSTVAVAANRKQGFWLGELHYVHPLFQVHQVLSGQNPATTVVNPLFATSPIPNGSCLVTADFSGSTLAIPASLTADLKVNIGISINQSFEWKDTIKNGKWDIYPVQEPVVDMGIRGMTAKILN